MTPIVTAYTLPAVVTTTPIPTPAPAPQKTRVRLSEALAARQRAGGQQLGETDDERSDPELPPWLEWQ